MPTTITSADVTSNLSNLLPTGTFLAFQTLAPLFSNNGDCGNVEKIMTGLLVGFFGLTCFLLTFSDSLTTHTGKVYYGIVTTGGLCSPQIKGSYIQGVTGMFYNDSSGKYIVNRFDFINGILNVFTFGTLSMLTSPITNCYYPGIPSTIVKCVPILVGLTVGMYFAFAPTARRGIGFAIVAGEILHEPAAGAAGTVTAKSSKNLDGGMKATLLQKGENKDVENREFPMTIRSILQNPAVEPGTPTPPLTPATSPLHRNPRPITNIFTQVSPNRDRISSHISSPIARASDL